TGTTAVVTGTDQNQNQVPDQSQAQVPDQNQSQSQAQTQGQNQVQGSQQVPGQGLVTVPAVGGSGQVEVAVDRRSSGVWTHSVLLDELAVALAGELVAAIGENRPTPRAVVGGFGRTVQERAARQVRGQALADYLRTMTNGYALGSDVSDEVLL